MNIVELKKAISNIEFSLNDEKDKTWFSIRREALESILNNHKELLLYKNQSLGLSPVEVGDYLYGIYSDTSDYLSENDNVEAYPIEKIIITKDGIFFAVDVLDSIICDLDSLVNGIPYHDMRFFASKDEAERELAAAKKRKFESANCKSNHHWIQIDDTKRKCSHCERTFLIYAYPDCVTRFCPHCGVKLKEPKVSNGIGKQDKSFWKTAENEAVNKFIETVNEIDSDKKEE